MRSQSEGMPGHQAFHAQKLRGIMMSSPGGELRMSGGLSSNFRQLCPFSPAAAPPFFGSETSLKNFVRWMLDRSIPGNFAVAVSLIILLLNYRLYIVVPSIIAPFPGHVDRLRSSPLEYFTRRDPKLLLVFRFTSDDDGTTKFRSCSALTLPGLHDLGGCLHAGESPNQLLLIHNGMSNSALIP